MSNLIQKIYECEKASFDKTIINALLWAAVLIASSLIIKDSEQANSLFMILIVASTMSILLPASKKSSE